MKLPFAVLAMASPLYTAPVPELSLAITPFVKFTLGFHPRMVPSSVAKRKRETPDLAFWEITKSELPLNTTPVGVPPVGAVGEGILTTRGEPMGKACPWPLYSVDAL